jgi:hypothetical protein
MKKAIGSFLGAAAIAALLASPASGQSLVKNPSFENNLNTNSAPLSAGAPMGWPYYSSIDEWLISGGGSGVNDVVYDAGGPFHNSGTLVPDGRRIGFKQGGGAVSQDLTGLVPNKRYWIQFRYDARSGSDLDLAVRFSTVNQGGAMDEELDKILKPKPAITTHSPYYSRTVVFTPDLDSGTLSFEVTTRGDATALLDAVTIVQRDEGNFPVMNPSFEASGLVFDGAPSAGQNWPAISGWDKVGVSGVDDGTGGVADNGAIPDQAIAVFMTDESSLTQTLEPLVQNDNYQLQFAYNAKSGTTPHLQVLVDGAVIWEKDVTAVGGTKPYATQTVTFKAAADIAKLAFSNTVAGATVLLDDVKVLGKAGTRLPPMEMSPAKVLLRGGEEATATLTIPADRLSLGVAVVKIASANTNIFTLPEADATGTVTLQFKTNTSLSFKVKAAAVGSAAVSITDSAGLLLPTDITTVYVAGTTLVLNPSFEMDKDSGVGSASVAGWTTTGGNIGMAAAGNPFLAVDDLTIPDRTKVLRMQSGGSISQMISGLQPGKLYGLQFFYNGRTAGYPYELALQVSFDGNQLTNIQSVTPAAQNGLTDYYFEELRFTPASSSGLLEFEAVVTSGDATVFLDAVSIVPRLSNEVAVKNSSFEGTAMGANWPGYIQNDRTAGWICAGGGYGVNAYSPKTFFIEPFLDNGINSDQDNAWFGQGAVTMKTTVSGLNPGQTYTLVFDYNNRDGRAQNSSVDPNPGQWEVSLDGTPIKTSDEYLPVDTVTPWPGFRHTKPFYQAFIPITPAADIAELQIAHVGINGDETLLIDNIRILPGTRTPPSITKELADQTVSSGATVKFAVAASGTGLSYRWYQDGVLLADGGAISGVTTATLTISNAKLANAGTYSAIVTDGVGVVGSSALLTVEEPVITSVPLAVRLAAGKVVISWPATATGLTLQHTPTLPAATTSWTNESSPATQVGDNWEVQVTPSVSAQYYRLVQ